MDEIFKNFKKELDKMDDNQLVSYIESLGIKLKDKKVK